MSGVETGKIAIEEIPPERASEFWTIQYRYLVDDGMIETEDERAYFQSKDYRDALDSYTRREPDRLHRVYFLRGGARVGASQYCTYLSEDGKCFILDFWVFPEYRGGGTGHKCFAALEDYAKQGGAKYFALNYAKEASRRFWVSLGFEDDGIDEYGSPRMVRRG